MSLKFHAIVYCVFSIKHIRIIIAWEEVHNMTVSVQLVGSEMKHILYVHPLIITVLPSLFKII